VLAAAAAAVVVDLVRRHLLLHLLPCLSPFPRPERGTGSHTRSFPAGPPLDTASVGSVVKGGVRGEEKEKIKQVLAKSVRHEARMRAVDSYCRCFCWYW